MTKEEIEKMAIEAGGTSMSRTFTLPEGPRTAIKFKVDDGSLEKFAQLIAAVERERCAKIAEMEVDVPFYIRFMT